MHLRRLRSFYQIAALGCVITIDAQCFCTQVLHRTIMVFFVSTLDGRKYTGLFSTTFYVLWCLDSNAGGFRMELAQMFHQSLTFRARPMFSSVIYAVADPETSERGGQETWNISHRGWWPSFFGLFLQAGGGGGMAPLPPLDPLLLWVGGILKYNHPYSLLGNCV